MLPFLQKRMQAAAIMSLRKKDGTEAAPSSKDARSDAEALLAAIEAKDPVKVMESLKKIFQTLDAQPHEEGPHESED